VATAKRLWWRERTNVSNDEPSNPQQPLENVEDLNADLDRTLTALKAAGQGAISPSDLRQCAAALRWKIGAWRSGLIRTNPDFCRHRH
jgi:hypothetical protein